MITEKNDGLDVNVDALTGYDAEDRYFASLYPQGTRRIYSLDLSLAGVAATVPRPDPGNPAPGNRKIDPRHAEDFATYVREKKDWVSPALILRAPRETFSFDSRFEIAGSQFGVLGVPRLARTDLRILDGQHRILGIHMAVEGIAKDLEKARQELNAARHGNPDVVGHWEDRIKTLLLQRDRLGHDRISVQIVLEEEEKGYKQMFVDIAENAKGITKTIQARFDTRKVVNRAMTRVIEHPLLNGRVEDQLDRVKSNDQILAAKHVAEIIRAVAVGLAGRMSKKREEELDEDDLVTSTTRFLKILCEAYPELQEVADGSLMAGELRTDGPRGSLLGSATMLRVLAGVYHELSRPTAHRGEQGPDPMSDEQVIRFLSGLRPYMGAPVTTDLWIKTGVVEAGTHAPRARGGDIRRLADEIVRWARQGLPVQPAA